MLSLKELLTQLRNRDLLMNALDLSKKSPLRLLKSILELPKLMSHGLVSLHKRHQKLPRLPRLLRLQKLNKLLKRKLILPESKSKLPKLKNISWWRKLIFNLNNLRSINLRKKPKRKSPMLLDKRESPSSR